MIIYANVTLAYLVICITFYAISCFQFHYPFIISYCLIFIMIALRINVCTNVSYLSRLEVVSNEVFISLTTTNLLVVRACIMQENIHKANNKTKGNYHKSDEDLDLFLGDAHASPCPGPETALQALFRTLLYIKIICSMYKNTCKNSFHSFEIYSSRA